MAPPRSPSFARQSSSFAHLPDWGNRLYRLEALLPRLVLALPAPLVRSRGSQSYGSSPPGVDRAKMPVIRQQSCWHEERRESCEKRETGSEANTPPGTRSEKSSLPKRVILEIPSGMVRVDGRRIRVRHACPVPVLLSNLGYCNSVLVCINRDSRNIVW